MYKHINYPWDERDLLDLRLNRVVRSHSRAHIT